MRGNLQPQLTIRPRSIHLVDDAGQTRSTYTCLIAFGSLGKDLPVQFELEGDALVMSLDASGATYPLTVDPVVQLA
ncbi:MAG: hypothetical protein ACI841_002556 [Planctomycetota bacterium]